MSAFEYNYAQRNGIQFLDAAFLSQQLSEADIVRAVARIAAERITRQVIRALQRMAITLSGSESGLQTTWDEICVQVHSQQSFFWPAYDETVRGLITGFVAELPEHEKEALWLQTDPGWAWRQAPPEKRPAYPLNPRDIIDHLAERRVYAAAQDWSNARIRCFMEQDSACSDN